MIIAATIFAGITILGLLILLLNQIPSINDFIIDKIYKLTGETDTDNDVVWYFTNRAFQAQVRDISVFSLLISVICLFIAELSFFTEECSILG